jgi:hypothetical protein
VEADGRGVGVADKPIGWADIAALATSEEGWATYDYPEWGNFKFGHTHPAYSNSGIVSVIAEAYAGVGKQRGLTLEDLQEPELKAFMGDVESSIIHYGISTGFFATRMFEGGPSYLSAAVMYENLWQSRRANGLPAKAPNCRRRALSQRRHLLEQPPLRYPECPLGDRRTTRCSGGFPDLPAG